MLIPLFDLIWAFIRRFMLIIDNHLELILMRVEILIFIYNIFINIVIYFLSSHVKSTVIRDLKRRHQVDSL